MATTTTRTRDYTRGGGGGGGVSHSSSNAGDNNSSRNIDPYYDDYYIPPPLPPRDEDEQEYNNNNNNNRTTNISRRPLPELHRFESGSSQQHDQAPSMRALKGRVLRYRDEEEEEEENDDVYYASGDDYYYEDDGSERSFQYGRDPNRERNWGDSRAGQYGGGEGGAGGEYRHQDYSNTDHSTSSRRSLESTPTFYRDGSSSHHNQLGDSSHHHRHRRSQYNSYQRQQHQCRTGRSELYEILDYSQESENSSSHHNKNVGSFYGRGRPSDLNEPTSVKDHTRRRHHLHHDDHDDDHRRRHHQIDSLGPFASPGSNDTGETRSLTSSSDGSGGGGGGGGSSQPLPLQSPSQTSYTRRLRGDLPPQSPRVYGSGNGGRDRPIRRMNRYGDEGEAARPSRPDIRRSSPPIIQTRRGGGGAYHDDVNNNNNNNSMDGSYNSHYSYGNPRTRRNSCGSSVGSRSAPVRRTPIPREPSLYRRDSGGSDASSIRTFSYRSRRQNNNTNYHGQASSLVPPIGQVDIAFGGTNGVCGHNSIGDCYREDCSDLTASHNANHHHSHHPPHSTNNRNNNDNNNNKDPVYVEIAPGTKEKLRGTEETYKAVGKDFYANVSCFGCTKELCVIADVSYVICPDCTVVSPLEGCQFEGKEIQRHGLGLGFTYDSLFKMQMEILKGRK